MVKDIIQKTLDIRFDYSDVFFLISYIFKYYVFCFFFLAAGKSTLFKISR
jgi:hypothetical protein